MSDIAALFQLDPLSLTKDNIDAIITYYRGARESFILGEKAAGSTKKMKEKSAPGPKLSSLDLDDLMNSTK